MMAHFNYINPVRNKDGKLREWEEYETLAKGEEQSCDRNKLYRRDDEEYDDYKAKVMANEKRSRI